MLTVYLTGAIVTAFWVWHYEWERTRFRASVTVTRQFDLRSLKVVLALAGATLFGLAWFITLPSALFTHLYSEPHG